MANLQGYIFRILQHFPAKLCKCPDSVFLKSFPVGDAVPKVGVETYSF